MRRLAVIGGALVLAWTALAIGSVVVGAEKSTWPTYCANHPHSKNRHCVPATTTTTSPATTTTSSTTTTSLTTTTTTLPTGPDCIVVPDYDQSTVLFSGPCDQADNFAYEHSGQGVVTYPVAP